MLLIGYAAGAKRGHSGSGSNYLCLHEEPQWKTYLDGQQEGVGLLAGVEYELTDSGRWRNNVFSKSNNGGNPLINNPMPCAVCYVQGRSTVLMIPARTECPDGWTTEYAGYVTSEIKTGKASSYICLDEAPEVATGGVSQNQALIYAVEVECGTLPCSVYLSGRELTCIVCSK